MDKYENHHDEWREEDKLRKLGINPDTRKCIKCGDNIDDLYPEFETCHSCFFEEASEENAK